MKAHRIRGAAVLLVALVSGCGVPTQDRAEMVNPENVPPPLIGTTTTTTTTTVPVTVAATTSPVPTTVAVTTTVAATTTATPPPPPPTQTVGLYFLQGARLLRVQRDVPITDTAAPLPPEDVLAELEAGPLPGDPPGLRSAVESGEVVSVVTNRGIATVDLLPSFRELDGEDQELAIAQIVLTLTDGGVGQVAFTIAGQTIQVPTAESLQTAGPLTREDYIRQLDPPEPAQAPETVAGDTPGVASTTTVASPPAS